jgi:hypothetical protein
MRFYNNNPNHGNFLFWKFSTFYQNFSKKKHLIKGSLSSHLVDQFDTFRQNFANGLIESKDEVFFNVYDKNQMRALAFYRKNYLNNFYKNVFIGRGLLYKKYKFLSYSKNLLKKKFKKGRKFYNK